MAALTRARRERRSGGPGAVRLVRGRARIERNSGDFTQRLQVGDIAVLDEIDLGLDSAKRLADRGIVGVVNAAPSLSGRIAVGGAGALLAAGIAVIDDVGPGLFGSVRDGDELVLDLDGGRLLGGRKAETVLARGTVLTSESVERTRLGARSSMAERSAVLVRDAIDLLATEEQFLFDTIPDLALPGAGRPVLFVGSGSEAAADLALAASWCAAARPVVVVVAATASVVLAAGLVPDVVITDDPAAQDVSGAAQRVDVCPPGADEDAAGGPEPADGGLLGPQVQRCTSGLPLDAAALALTQSTGPSVIVTAGVPAQLSDYLDASRAGGAGLLLAGLRSPARCVPAAVAAVLAPSRRRRRGSGLVLVLAALIAAAAILAVSDAGQVLLHRWFPGWHPWW